MLNRRSFVASVVAAAVIPSAFARRFHGGAPAGLLAANYVGINALDGINYFTVEQPLLNIMKMASAGSAYSYNGLSGEWLTSKSGTADTEEEAYLAATLDADGWPTTLVVSGIPGGQQFTFVQTFIFTGISATLPPGASEPYPGGSGITYQIGLTWKGPGTINFVGVTNLTVTGGSNVAASGTQLISTIANGTTSNVTATFNMDAANGLQIQITALNNDGVNYPKIPYIVDSRYVANYNAGELLHPYFKAAMTGNGVGAFSCLRVMGALATYQQEYKLTFTGNLAMNAQSGTISSLTVQGSSFTTWPFPTGTRKVVFATGQTATMSGTYGSASVTWDTMLSSAINTSAVGAMCILSLQSGWAARPLLSNATWSGPAGPPAEAYMAICNELNIDCWPNAPAAAAFIDSTYFSNWAALAYNGADANLTNSNLSFFPGVVRRIKPEYSNEVFNFGAGYQEADFCEMMGVYAGFSAAQGSSIYGGAEWYGTQCAAMGDAFYAEYGAAMAARCTPVVMNQSGTGGGAGLMAVAMNTPDWTSRAYAHHIGAYGCAPYFGPTYAGANYGGMSSGDATTIAALGNPLTELYSLAYTNVGASSNTYSSVPTDGWLGAAIAGMAAYISSFSAQPWYGLPVLCYEGGLDLGNYSGYAGLAPYLTDMLTDVRTSYLLNDPTHQLSGSGTGYLPELAGAGVSSVNLLNMTGTQWGMVQTIPQMASTPPYTDVPQLGGVIAYAA